MTKDGAMKLITTIAAAYTNYHPADIVSTVHVWLRVLEGYQDDEVAVALKAYILSDTKGFPPSIGQIVALIPRNRDDGMSELEAWGLVQKAVRNGNYGAEEEFAKLPDTIRLAIGGPGQIREWAAIGSDDFATVAQSNFLRSYRAVVERKKMAVKLPRELRELYHRAMPETKLLEEKEPHPEETKSREGIPMPEEYMKKLGLAV